MKEQLILLAIWNIFVMFVYFVDKYKAKKGYRRIRERTLLIISFVLGGYGAIFGMVVFNHKTSKMKFRLLIPLSVFVCTTVLYFVNSIKFF